jgi:hypothetical protein
VRPRLAPVAVLLARVLAAPAAGASAPTPAEPAPFFASAAECFEAASRQPRAVFDVVVSSYPTVFERGLTIKEVNVLRSVPLPPVAVAHGLSMIDFGVRSKTKTEVLSWGRDGRVCAWAAKVFVDLTPSPIRIYIPSEYPPGRCESNTLSRHELLHEALFRAAVDRAARRLRDAFAHASSLAGPAAAIDAAAPEDAYARLRGETELIVRPIYRQLVQESRRDQEGLDSDETYRALGAACSGWKRGPGPLAPGPKGPPADRGDDVQ